MNLNLLVLKPTTNYNSILTSPPIYTYLAAEGYSWWLASTLANLNLYSIFVYI